MSLISSREECQLVKGISAINPRKANTKLNEVVDVRAKKEKADLDGKRWKLITAQSTTPVDTEKVEALQQVIKRRETLATIEYQCKRLIGLNIESSVKDISSLTPTFINIDGIEEKTEYQEFQEALSNYNRSKSLSSLCLVLMELGDLIYGIMRVEAFILDPKKYVSVLSILSRIQENCYELLPSPFNRKHKIICVLMAITKYSLRNTFAENIKQQTLQMSRNGVDYNIIEDFKHTHFPKDKAIEEKIALEVLKNYMTDMGIKLPEG